MPIIPPAFGPTFHKHKKFVQLVFIHGIKFLKLSDWLIIAVSLKVLRFKRKVKSKILERHYPCHEDQNATYLSRGSWLILFSIPVIVVIVSIRCCSLYAATTIARATKIIGLHLRCRIVVGSDLRLWLVRFRIRLRVSYLLRLLSW